MQTSPDKPSGAEPRVVKRYANRKLYDTRESRYVTLQQIAEYVRMGDDVRIIDNNSKEDLTDVTLAQIIYEEQKNKADGQARSLGTLRGLIQRGGERLMTTLRDGPMGKLVRSEPPPGGVGAEPQAEPKKSVMAQGREALDELHRLADDRMRALVGVAATYVQQLQAEIRRLQDRIEELEERLRRGRPSKREAGSDKPSEEP